MLNNIKELLDKYQVRKTYKQKSEFIDWLNGKSKEMDYELIVDEYSKKGRNLVVGDVGKAEVILTAHYDTQPNFFLPMITGINWIGFIISQIFIVIVLIYLSDLVGSLSKYIVGEEWGSTIGFVVLVIFLFQMTYGIANKNTANDNTSGVATLLWIMEDIPIELREKVLFVFFDEEEKGLIGSKAFKGLYGEKIENIPLINFDCVSNGDNLGFIKKKAFRNSKYSDLLNESVINIIGSNKVDKKYFIGSALEYIYPSDQLRFKNSVGVAALKYIPIFGYFLNGIHNSRDKVFMEENIELLKDTMMDFVGKL